MYSLYTKLGILLYPLLLPLMRPVLRRTKRVYVMLTYEGKVVVVKNWLARNDWRFAGGGIARNESEVEAAAREIKEELRIVLAPSGLKKIAQGTIRADRLNIPYVLYGYELGIAPSILQNRWEIVEFGIFDTPPKAMHPDFLPYFPRSAAVE